ncbi:MAG: type II and III secretion system protein [Planctomycetes bacterium]|nr:type II and III secretion system protein [Planctomycetota bacterium]
MLKHAFAGLFVLAFVAGCPKSSPPPAREDTFTQTQRMIEEAQQLPVAAGNYRIDVERVWLQETDAWAVDAMFGYSDGQNAVRVGRPNPNAAFRVAVGGGKFRSQFSATMSQTKSSRREQQTVVTMADYPASISVGQVRYGVPVNLGRRRGIIVVPEGQFVGASLEVMISNRADGHVDVELIPVYSGLGPGGSNVQLTEMQTAVRVPLGQPILIGSTNRNEETATSGLLSRRSSRGTEQAVIVLTVRG